MPWKQGHQIAALLHCFGGGEQTGPVAGLLSDGECAVAMRRDCKHVKEPEHFAGVVNG
jgi:hypothetical protein